jgi:hypothetical protein
LKFDRILKTLSTKPNGKGIHVTQELSTRDVWMLPMNNRKCEQGRKRQNLDRKGWVVGILMTGMVVFPFLLFMPCSGVAFAATLGPTSLTDKADERYEAEGDSRWYASDQGE